MDGKALEPCHRYLLRVNRKQVPVVYDGYGLWEGHGGREGLHHHAFTRLDNGEWVFKRRASAISCHYDDCQHHHCNHLSINCSCQKRLEAVR